MSLAELVEKLEGENCFVCKVSSRENTLHVDGDCLPHSRGLPDWIWSLPNWRISTCGWKRIFMTKIS